MSSKMKSDVCYRPCTGDTIWWKLQKQPQLWRKVMAAYCRVDSLKSHAGWPPVHRDQLRAQLSIMSVGELYFLLYSGNTENRHKKSYFISIVVSTGWLG